MRTPIYSKLRPHIHPRAGCQNNPLQLHTRLDQQGLPRPQICNLVCLGLRREGPVRSPKVDQRLHRLQLMRPQQVERDGGQQEVAEAAVQLLLEVEVVEWLDEVGVVHVRVDAEHLEEDGLADGQEVLWETAPPAGPVPVGRVGDVGEGLLRGDGRVDGVGDAGGFGGEDVGVVDLAGYPPLHEGYILVCRQFNGLIATVQPGV